MPDTVGSLLGGMRPKPLEKTGEEVREEIVDTGVDDDLSGEYNTPIPKKLKGEYEKWLEASGREADIANYDIQGYWLEEVKAKGIDPLENGTVPPKYAKPNNPLYGQKEAEPEAPAANPEAAQGIPSLLGSMR